MSPITSLAEMIIEDDRSSRSWFYGPEADRRSGTDLLSTRGDDMQATASPYEIQSGSRNSAPADSSTTIGSPFICTEQKDGIDDTWRSCHKTSKLSHDMDVPNNSNVLSPATLSPSMSSHSWYTKWFRDWWALEVGSMILGTTCIVIIAVMLLGVDGKEMPRWRLGITVDAILSLLAGASKSCLLMPTAEALGQMKWMFGKRHDNRAIDVDRIDRASRGTWGSMILLIRTRGVTLASLGAAIILLSLPLDMCFQQIVRYPVEPVLDQTTNATIARAVCYDPPDERQYQGQGYYNIKEDSQIAAFLYPSFFSDSKVRPSIGVSCPTGNCTFSPFRTLSVDYECKPLPSTLLSFACQTSSNEWHSSVAAGWGNETLIDSCGYFLDVPSHPNGSQLMSGYEVTANGTIGDVLTTRLFGLVDVFSTRDYLGGSILFNRTKDRIVDFIIASTPGGFDGVRANHTPVLQECEVHWTIEEIQATVSNGLLLEKTIATLPLSDDKSTNSHWDSEDSAWYTHSPSLKLPDPHSLTGESTYSLDNTTARKVWQVLAMVVPSVVLQAGADTPIAGQKVMKLVYLNADGPQAPHFATDFGPSSPWDTPHNISAKMAEITTTMNHIIRNNVASVRKHKDAVNGQVFRNVVLVRVRWTWFTFPAVLWCIAVFFLTMTIWKSSNVEKNAGPYKTSLLPMLLDPRREVTDTKILSRSMGSMRKQAKSSTFRVGMPQDKRVKTWSRNDSLC